MVVVFSKFRGAHIADKKHQEYYKKQFSDIGHMKNDLARLNLCFNNQDHNMSPNFSDVHSFLKELQRVARSKVHTLEIHGSEHEDPSFRTSYNIITSDYNQSMYPQIKDTYLTISVRMGVNNANSKPKFSILIPNTKYHIIVAFPTINPATNLGFVNYKC